MSAGDHDFAVAVDRALYSAREPDRGAPQPGASGLTKCIMTTMTGLVRPTTGSAYHRGGPVWAGGPCGDKCLRRDHVLRERPSDRYRQCPQISGV